jgi:hypothetical protein
MEAGGLQPGPCFLEIDQPAPGRPVEASKGPGDGEAPRPCRRGARPIVHEHEVSAQCHGESDGGALAIVERG